MILVVCFLHCVLDVILDRAVERKLQVVAVHHGLERLSRIGELHAVPVTLVVERAVRTFKLLVVKSLQARHGLALPVGVAQHMRGQRIFRIITLLVADIADPRLTDSVLLLDLVAQGDHLVDNGLIHLPAFIADLAAFPKVALLVFGVNQLFQLGYRLVQNLVKPLHDLVPDTLRMYHFRIDDDGIGRHVACKNRAIAVGNLSALGLDDRCVRPGITGFLLPEIALQHLNPKYPSDQNKKKEGNTSPYKQRSKLYSFYHSQTSLLFFA
ncbi:hypothetical protein D3C73_1034910 [compost metagenome]